MVYVEGKSAETTFLMASVIFSICRRPSSDEGEERSLWRNPTASNTAHLSRLGTQRSGG